MLQICACMPDTHVDVDVISIAIVTYIVFYDGIHPCLLTASSHLYSHNGGSLLGPVNFVFFCTALSFSSTESVKKLTFSQQTQASFVHAFMETNFHRRQGEQK